MNPSEKKCLPASSAAAYTARPASHKKLSFCTNKTTTNALAHSAAVAQALHDGLDLADLAKVTSRY
jgi:hypothetical protein